MITSSCGTGNNLTWWNRSATEVGGHPIADRSSRSLSPRVSSTAASVASAETRRPETQDVADCDGSVVMLVVSLTQTTHLSHRSGLVRFRSAIRWPVTDYPPVCAHHCAWSILDVTGHDTTIPCAALYYQVTVAVCVAINRY
jgi:hypothetical protein